MQNTSWLTNEEQQSSTELLDRGTATYIKVYGNSIVSSQLSRVWLTMTSSKPSSYSFPLYLQSPTLSAPESNRWVILIPHVGSLNNFVSEQGKECFFQDPILLILLATGKQALIDNVPLLKGVAICRKEHLLLWLQPSTYFTFICCKIGGFSPEKADLYKLIQLHCLLCFSFALLHSCVFHEDFQGPPEPILKFEKPGIFPKVICTH